MHAIDSERLAVQSQMDSDEHFEASVRLESMREFDDMYTYTIPCTQYDAISMTVQLPSSDLMLLLLCSTSDCSL